MKNLSKFIFAFVIGLITFVSCDKTVLGPTIVITGTGGTQVPTYVVPQNNNGEFGIVFGGYTQATKASVVSTLGNGYDDFTLYAWNSNGTKVMNPYSVYANSNGYYYEGIGSQELQYFKNNTDYYDFIGIIPSSKVMTLDDDKVLVNDIKSFVVDDDRVNGTLTEDSPEEFLYSYKRVVKNNYNQPVVLPFEHGNALLYIGFKSDRNDTELLDYTPSKPEVPATPDTETYTKKTTKFIDELVAGNEVQVAIGFYGASSPKLTETQPNPLYVGSDNTSNGWLAKTWLLSIKDAVNAQFVYYRLNSVVNSTSKTETTEDWESAASNKNIFMMKLADGVDKAEFAAGNDVFWNALVAHETDWFGGSPAMSFKQTFAQAYADGWRVVRINVSDTNTNQVLVFLSNNIETSTQVCTITPGTPYQPAIPGINGIRVFSANYESEHYVHVAHTTNADATISSQGVTFNNRANSTEVIPFSLPSETTLNSTPVFSPTTFYAVPGDTNVKDFVVKFSYTYNGETVYDVRVPLVLPEGGLQPGKYYKYIINITSTANGNNNPGDAEDKKDDIDVVEDIPITLNVSVNTYNEGIETTYDI